VATERISIVVTTIFRPGKAMQALSDGASRNSWDLIVVGDARSPRDFRLNGADYHSLESQRTLPFRLAPIIPVGHYTRKNLGYLIAINKGAQIIIETDDDNIPVEGFWSRRKLDASSTVVSGNGWFNVYDLFTNEQIWPRGFPLECLKPRYTFDKTATDLSYRSPVQQGLADGDPDVDAVYRMTGTLPFTISRLRSPVRLNNGVWCPFNSQNTTWFREAFLLLYLPSYCSFRMTDIWRSFVAQRIAWECGWGIVFHNATVFQDRNEHNILRDFVQEIPGYLMNDKIRIALERLPLKPGPANISSNLFLCYEELIKMNAITDQSELALLEAWIYDVESCAIHG
jgi:hypothetical protein